MPKPPKPAEILAARKAACITQTEAAALVFVGLRAWQMWEAGDRAMHPAFWLLFRWRLKGSAPVD